jgi:hypothetical protein
MLCGTVWLNGTLVRVDPICKFLHCRIIQASIVACYPTNLKTSQK